MRVFVLIGITILCSVQSVLGQESTMDGNLAKYWYYRWRLRNDFMIMGEGQGKSLVAEQRNPERSACIKWADATLMHGYYLSMLAVEHRILSESGRQVDLNETNKELYYAIKAFERLDYWAETIYSMEGNDDTLFRTADQPLRSDVNGFFFRDDVPPDFINEALPPDNFFNSNHSRLNSGRTGINYSTPSNYTSGDFSKYFEPFGSGSYPRINWNEPLFPRVDHNYGNSGGGMNLGEPSQDQIIRLLLGFTMIVKSIPNQTYSIDLDGDGTNDVSMNFQDQAKRHATNIIGRISDVYSGTRQVEPELNEIHSFNNNLGGWFIRSPRELKCFPGGYVTGYAPPIRALSYLLYTPNNDLGIANVHSINSRLPSGFFAWQVAWGSGSGVGYNDNVNVKMALTLNTLTNSGNTPHVWSSVPRSIYEESKGNGNHEWRLHGYFVPLYDYLWGWNPSKQKDQERLEDSYELANSWLNVAPCQGPHNFGLSNHSYASNSGAIYPSIGAMSTDQYGINGIPPVWNTPFLFDNGYEVYSDGFRDVNVDPDGCCNNYILPNQNVWEGWFSGVDYMMLYNIIYANSSEIKPLYHNLVNRIVDYEVNLDANLSSITGENQLLGGYENLKLRSYVHGNGSIEIKALDYIQLENGAEINPELSGEIVIYPDLLKCPTPDLSSDNEQYGMTVCNTCGLEEQMGLAFVPKFDRRVLSIAGETTPLDEIPEVTELNSEEIQEGEHVMIYPNPAVSSFKLSSDKQIVSVQILNLSATLVAEYTQYVEYYDIRLLASGTYFILIKFEDESSEMLKLVKI